MKNSLMDLMFETGFLTKYKLVRPATVATFAAWMLFFAVVGKGDPTFEPTTWFYVLLAAYVSGSIVFFTAHYAKAEKPTESVLFDWRFWLCVSPVVALALAIVSVLVPKATKTTS
jgi:hypothetical protein